MVRSVFLKSDLLGRECKKGIDGCYAFLYFMGGDGAA